MKVIYVAGKYRASTDWAIEYNIQLAEKAAIKLWQEGWAVICPHKNTAHFGGVVAGNSEEDHMCWINGDLEILSRCNAIYMLKNWELSGGARKELALAKQLGLEIYYEEQ